MSSLLFPEFEESLETWKSYFHRFHCHCLAHDVRSDRKVPLLLSSLGRNTFKLLSGLCAPAEPLQKTLEEIDELLSEHFRGQVNVHAERFKFPRMTQSETETINEFMARLRIQAADCTFENLDAAHREQFVQGLYNEGLQKRLLCEDKPLSDIVKLAQGIEVAAKGSDIIHGSKSEVHHVRTFHKPTTVPRQSHRRPVPKKANPPTPRTPCGRCGEMHFSDTCKFRDAQCFGCGKLGHIRKVCRSKPKSKQTADREQVNAAFPVTPRKQDVDIADV